AAAVREVEGDGAVGQVDLGTAAFAFAPRPVVRVESERVADRRARHHATQQEHAAVDVVAEARVARLPGRPQPGDGAREPAGTVEDVVDVRVPDAHDAGSHR